MEATLKRRMWKVAIAHLALSVFLGLFFFSFLPVMDHLGHGHFQSQSDLTKLVWAWSLVGVFFVLQPQFSLILAKDHIADSLPLGVIIGILFPIIAPFWSYYFAKLFVKFDNWLNHFPFLGKKVF